MVKRYEKYVTEADRIKEDVSKRNVDIKNQAEIESVQKLQQFHKVATYEEVGTLDRIVRQSGLKIEEVLRRQRRKKRYFYDNMHDRFKGYWNKKVEFLSQVKYPFGEGMPK